MMKLNRRGALSIVLTFFLLVQTLGYGIPSAAADPTVFDMAKITGGVSINANGKYAIKDTGTPKTTSHRISVGANLTVSITLSGVTVDVSGTNYACAFSVGAGSTVFLTLSGANTLKSGLNCAGIAVPSGAALTIGVVEGDTTSSLNVTGGIGGAGIGGGTVNISGGTITVTGGSGGIRGGAGDGGGGGAGIGGAGGSGAGGGNGGNTVNISGGTVTVNGGRGGGAGNSGSGGGAGIGGGGGDGNGCNGGNGCNTVNISGGTVTVTGGIGGGAGIGGDGIGGGGSSGSGSSGSGGTVNISGGTVNVYGGVIAGKVLNDTTKNDSTIYNGRGICGSLTVGDNATVVNVYGNPAVKGTASVSSKARFNVYGGTEPADSQPVLNLTLSGGNTIISNTSAPAVILGNSSELGTDVVPGGARIDGGTNTIISNGQCPAIVGACLVGGEGQIIGSKTPIEVSGGSTLVQGGAGMPALGAYSATGTENVYIGSTSGLAHTTRLARALGTEGSETGSETGYPVLIVKITGGSLVLRGGKGSKMAYDPSLCVFVNSENEPLEPYTLTVNAPDGTPIDGIGGLTEPYGTNDMTVQDRTLCLWLTKGQTITSLTSGNVTYLPNSNGVFEAPAHMPVVSFVPSDPYLKQTLTAWDGVSVKGEIMFSPTLIVAENGLWDKDCAVCGALKQLKAAGRLYGLYDVRLNKSFRGTLELSFDVSDKYADGETLTVVHDLGEETTCGVCTVKDGRISVKVTSLGRFAVVEGDAGALGQQ